MPLVRIDVIEGRTTQEISDLLDAAHRALVSAFSIPERDRYQIINEHSPTHLIFQDTGLGIERTKELVAVTITSRPRSEKEKLRFYEELCRELFQACGTTPNDIFVCITTNTDADWSFGNGRAQFLTGEL